MKKNVLYTMLMSTLLLTTSNISVIAAELKDCSQVKKLHKKLACHLGVGESEKEIDNKLNVNKLLKPTLADYFKKEK